MLTAQEVDLVDELSKSFSLKVSENTESMDQRIVEKLKDSYLFSEYYDKYFYKSFRINNSSADSYLLLYKNSYEMQRGKYDVAYSELQVVGIKALRSSYGNLLIRPETFEDKVRELFLRKEIDIEDYPAFSSGYYFLADDENSACSFASPKRTRLIENQKEIVIHISKSTLIAKFCRSLTHEDFAAMIEFISEI